MDEPIWSPTTFGKTPDGLLDGDIAGASFDAVPGQAEAAGVLSDEHITVDRPLLEGGRSIGPPTVRVDSHEFRQRPAP